MIEAALKYFERGWHPVVLEPAERGNPESGKRPIGKWKDSPEWTIESLQRAFRGNVNIGLDCGQSGLVVIDCDSPEGLEHAMKVCEPTGTIAESGGSGRHLFYSCPEGIIVSNRQRIMGLGLDRRGHGGLIVVEPSNHYSGGSYTFLTDNALTEYNPNWFREPEIYPIPKLVDGTEDTNFVRYRARRYASKIEAVQGSRDATAFRVACVLVQKFGLDAGEALEELKIWNHYRVSPPLPESRLAYKIRESIKLSHRQ